MIILSYVAYQLRTAHDAKQDKVRFPRINLLRISVNKGLVGLPLHSTPARTAGRLHTAGKHKYGDYRYPQQPHQGCHKRE